MVLASPLQVEHHLPPSIPSCDSASNDVSHEASIPLEAEKGVIIYYVATVLDWKQQLAGTVNLIVLELARLEMDKAVIRKTAIGVARLAIAKMAPPADWMVRSEAGISFDLALRLQFKREGPGRLLQLLLSTLEVHGGHVYLDTGQSDDNTTEYHAESVMLVVQRTLEEVFE